MTRKYALIPFSVAEGRAPGRGRMLPIDRDTGLALIDGTSP